MFAQAYVGVAGKANRPYGAPNWGNISGTDSADNTGSAFVAGGSRQIKFTASSVAGLGTLTLRPVVGGVAGTALTLSDGATQTFTHGQGLSCYFLASITGAPGVNKNCTITVVNASEGDAALDTFTVSVTVSP